MTMTRLAVFLVLLPLAACSSNPLIETRDCCEDATLIAVDSHPDPLKQTRHPGWKVCEQVNTQTGCTRLVASKSITGSAIPAYGPITDWRCPP